MKNSEYNHLKNAAYRRYKLLGKRYCPHLKCEVSFNSNGFRHLVFKAKNKRRDISSQIMRFGLLEKAAHLIQVTSTIQEYDYFDTQFYANTANFKGMKRLKIEYFGYIAILDGRKIKVIVKKVGDNPPFFWSVIPNWVTNKKRDSKRNYVNYVGIMEED